MPAEREWPPEKERPQRVTKPPRPNQHSSTDTTSHRQEAEGSFQSNGATRQCSATRLRRRRAAAQRMPPLDCGCRDPWPCRCYATEPQLSEHALDGWRDAALKVLSGGHVPLLPIEVRRALWKRGGPDRTLAERLHEACGQEVA
jgi:hypothetical protein